MELLAQYFEGKPEQVFTNADLLNIA